MKTIIKNKYIQTILSIILLTLLSGCGSSSSKETSCSTLSRDQIITIPINIYQYKFTHESQLSSQFSENKIIDYMANSNEIWEQANIKFEVQTIETIKINDEIFRENDYKSYTNLEFLTELNKLSTTHIEVNNMTKKGIWTLIFVHDFPVDSSGNWSDAVEAVYLAEYSKGTDTAYNMVAHQLGHTIGLLHVDPLDSPENLMISGNNSHDTSTLLTLTESQINRAREFAWMYLKEHQ